MALDGKFNSSNCIMTSWRGLILIAVILAMAIVGIPSLWRHFESFEFNDNFRIPYELSTDYWFYNNGVQKACEKYSNIIIGDSFIWGEYVDSNNTLSSCLSRTTVTSQKFVNLGVNGLHPAAAYGLIKYYAPEIRRKHVILFFNPLWIQSPEIDLQGTDELSLQHTQLLSQFDTSLKCYQAACNDRLAAVFACSFQWFGFASHIGTLYFNDIGIKKWSVENYNTFPGLNREKLRKLILNSRQVHTEAQAWFNRNIEPENYQWVRLDTSIQWKYFKKTVELLMQRGNSVFVLVGSFNPYIILSDSLPQYQNLRKEFRQELDVMQVNYIVIPDMPSEYYTDASHVDSRGYKMIAEQLAVDPNFQQWCTSVSSR
jgi:hypothetical protein